MLRLVRFILTELFFVALIGYAGFNSHLILYGLAQGKGQLHVLLAARPVEDVLRDPAFPDSLKRKLVLIQEIKKFAVDSLGLRNSENYTSMYDQKDRPVLWTVTASDPFQMHAYEWYFPFLGSVSYKGFFNYEAGRLEAEKLRTKGYDVEYAGVGGWSTLGWFHDPILSHMLNRNAGQLADLIIHELTHGTLYVHNKVDFNENLASFIGDKGAERFLRYRYGLKSEEYKTYIQSKSDRKIYNAYILKQAEGLDSLYHSFRGNETVMEKESLKMAYIYRCLEGVGKLELYHLRGYIAYTRDALEVKNAFFMSFRRYDSKYDVFDADFRSTCGADIRKYVLVLLKRMQDSEPLIPGI
jgi:predicted aminopeptidase